MGISSQLYGAVQEVGLIWPECVSDFAARFDVGIFSFTFRVGAIQLVSGFLSDEMTVCSCMFSTFVGQRMLRSLLRLQLGLPF